MLRNTMRYKSSLGIKDKTWKNWAESIDNIIKSINGNKKEIKIEEIGSGKITTLKEIIENILKNLKKNNLKKFKYGAFGGLIQKEKRIRRLLTKIIDFLNNINNGETRQKLFNDPKLSITRNLKKAYNTAIKTNQSIASEGQPRSSTTTPNSSTINLNFLKKDFEQLNKLYKENISDGNDFTQFDTIKNKNTLDEFCDGMNTLNQNIKVKIGRMLNNLSDNTDKNLKIYKFIVSYNNFINNLKNHCTSQMLEKINNSRIKQKFGSRRSSSGDPPPVHDFPNTFNCDNLPSEQYMRNFVKDNDEQLIKLFNGMKSIKTKCLDIYYESPNKLSEKISKIKDNKNKLDENEYNKIIELENRFKKKKYEIRDEILQNIENMCKEKKARCLRQLKAIRKILNEINNILKELKPLVNEAYNKINESSGADFPNTFNCDNLPDEDFVDTFVTNYEQLKKLIEGLTKILNRSCEQDKEFSLEDRIEELNNKHIGIEGMSNIIKDANLLLEEVKRKRLEIKNTDSEPMSGLLVNISKDCKRNHFNLDECKVKSKYIIKKFNELQQKIIECDNKIKKGEEKAGPTPTPSPGGIPPPPGGIPPPPGGIPPPPGGIPPPPGGIPPPPGGRGNGGRGNNGRGRGNNGRGRGNNGRGNNGRGRGNNGRGNNGRGNNGRGRGNNGRGNNGRGRGNNGRGRGNNGRGRGNRGRGNGGNGSREQITKSENNKLWDLMNKTDDKFTIKKLMFLITKNRDNDLIKKLLRIGGLEDCEKPKNFTIGQGTKNCGNLFSLYRNCAGIINISETYTKDDFDKFIDCINKKKTTSEL
jgi:hypothetical protein